MKFLVLALLTFSSMAFARPTLARPAAALTNTDQKMAGEENDEDDDDIREADPRMIYGNVSLASDYVLRGFTQTDHRPALQGGFDWSHPSGFSLGVWGSNVYFPESLASLELDGMGAYQYQISEVSALKLGLTYYSYQGDNQLNGIDIPVAYIHGPLTFEVDYSPSWQNQGVSWYYQMMYRRDLPRGFFGEIAAGYASVSGDSSESYPDARVAVAHEIYGIMMEATVIIVREQDLHAAQSASTVIISASQSL